MLSRTSVVIHVIVGVFAVVSRAGCIPSDEVEAVWVDVPVIVSHRGNDVSGFRSSLDVSVNECASVVECRCDGRWVVCNPHQRLGDLWFR